MAKKREKKKEEIKLKYSGLIVRPRATEKASLLQAEGNVYAFEINPKATKIELAKEIKKTHGVTPLRINIVKNPAKKIFMRGKKGFSQGVKKAYVFLKQGDKLE